MKNICVLGGGISGLTAAYYTGSIENTKVSLYEKEKRVGGVSGYFEFEGLKMDYGAHKIYSILPGVMDEFIKMGEGRLDKIKKDHRIILRGKLLDYPVKFMQVLPVYKPLEIIDLALSVAFTMAATPLRKTPVSYEDYCVSVFGRKIYESVFKPLAIKTWGDPKLLSADIGRTRIPTKNIYDLILRVTGIKKESHDTNAEFMFYPKKGFYDICDCICEKIKKKGDSINTGRVPKEFVVKNCSIEQIIFDDGSRKDADVVISSIPLEETYRLLFPGSKDSKPGDDFIPMRHSVIVYIMVNKPYVMKNQWIFCADRDIIFSRITEQKLISSSIFPADKTVLSCDFTCDSSSQEWSGRDDTIAEECIKGLEKLGFIKASEAVSWKVARLPFFYPIYRIGYKEKLKTLVGEISKIRNIVVTGRLGLSTYLNIDHCLDMSMYIADKIKAGESPSSINNGLLERVLEYKIVD